MIRASIITIPGFRQDDGPKSGLAKLHGKLIERYPGRNHVYPVALRTWDDDMWTLAAHIVDRDPDVTVVVGYSYGCGWGTPQLAEALAQYGRKIDLLCAIDPVPRFRFLPAKAISLTRWGKYKVPHNVIDCIYWRQVNGSPFGRVPDHPVERLQCGGVWGTSGNLAKHATYFERACRHYSRDSHADLDDRPDIHARIIELIDERIDP